MEENTYRKKICKVWWKIVIFLNFVFKKDLVFGGKEFFVEIFIVNLFPYEKNDNGKNEWCMENQEIWWMRQNFRNQLTNFSMGSQSNDLAWILTITLKSSNCNISPIWNFHSLSIALMVIGYPTIYLYKYSPI